MKFDKVIIKQIPDDYASMTGLHKYNRSKMPKTFEYLQVGYGPDGRALTGIDEDSYAVNNIKDPEARAAKKEELKSLRESLQKLTQKDLTATSPFWETFGVHISSDSDLILNRSNPLHVLFYHTLVENGYVAPDKDSAAHPRYRSAKYYCHVEERADQEEVSTLKLKNRAGAQLEKVAANHDYMVKLGQYLEGDKYKVGMSDDTLYRLLSLYIENKKEPDNIKRFLKAAELPVEELQYKITIDKAIKKKMIRVKDGYYQRGQVTLGKTPREVYQNLTKPEFATEFLSIQEELEG